MKSISCAEKKDIRIIARIHTECWREAYPFMPGQVHLNRNYQFRLEQWNDWLADRSGLRAVFVVEAANQIVGFAAVKPNDDPDIDAIGDLHACYLLPEYRGTSLGPLAMREMASFLYNSGQWPACIWAFRESPYRRIYPQLGAVATVFRDRVIAGCRLPEIGYLVSDYEIFAQRLNRMISSAAQRQTGSLRRPRRVAGLPG